MSDTLNLKKNIESGRVVHITPLGEEIDVVHFVSALANHDFTLVTRGMAEWGGVADQMFAPQEARIQ